MKTVGRSLVVLSWSEIDRRMLRALQQDRRMTVQAIADRVGLSASPCLRRIRQKERVGLPVSVFISIKLERQRATELDRFAEASSALPEVME